MMGDLLTMPRMGPPPPQKKQPEHGQVTGIRFNCDICGGSIVVPYGEINKIMWAKTEERREELRGAFRERLRLFDIVHGRCEARR